MFTEIKARFTGAVLFRTATPVPFLGLVKLAHLSGADLSRANLSGANLSRANLSGADLENVTVNWTSHTLLSELLWRAADTQSREMVAAWIGRKTGLCWPDFARLDHPEKSWALGVLAQRVTDGDDAPALLRRLKPTQAA